MPARKATSTPGMTNAQSQFVLRRLIENGTVTSRDVSAVASQIQNEIDSLQDQLTALREASGDGTPMRARRGRPRKTEGAGETTQGRKKGRRKQTLTPERRATLRLQGRYLALMRRTPKTKRARYKKLFKSQGLPAALKALEAANR